MRKRFDLNLICLFLGFPGNGDNDLSHREIKLMVVKGKSKRVKNDQATFFSVNNHEYKTESV